MGPNYFIDRATRRAHIDYCAEVAGFQRVTREQFEAFRAANRAWFAQQVRA